jgi:hypothetical protein
LDDHRGTHRIGPVPSVHPSDYPLLDDSHETRIRRPPIRIPGGGRPPIRTPGAHVIKLFCLNLRIFVIS